MSTNINVLGHIEEGDVDDTTEENGQNICENYVLNSETVTTTVTGTTKSNDLIKILHKDESTSPGSPIDETMRDKVYPKESKFVSDSSSDSGVDLTDAALPTSDSEISPSKNLKPSNSDNSLNIDQSNVIPRNGSDFSTQSSVSPENLPTDAPSPSPESSPANDKSMFVPKETKEVTNKTEYSNNLLNIHNKNYAELNPINSTLTISSLSLNEQNISNNVLHNSLYSRSVENISTLKQNNEDTNIDITDNDFDTEAILSEFSNQKTKVTAVQTIPETPMNLDVRYSRIPKEILSQDIGSIVKNVHGLFSSVSGSLKNAYTHRTSVQKSIKPVKPITNGKIMSDIFEDENIEPESEGKTKTAESTPESNAEVIKKEQGNTEFDDDTKRDVLRLQVETLERLLAEQRRENTSLREREKQHVDEAHEKDQTFKDLENKLDMMTKRVEQAEREKDAAVMRYASVECTRIEAKRAAEAAAKSEKAVLAEVELLNTKLKSAHAEKQRICQLYDDKCHELQKTERDMTKLREDLRELEGRLKWTQSKLRMEMDAYKESSERAEKLSQQVAELEAAKETAATNATDSAKAKQLESELKETQAALIMCRHDKVELERRLSAITTQLDISTREKDAATCCLTRLTTEVEQLKASNLRLEEEAAELAALRAQAALADTLSAQLQRESERASQAEEALSVERALAETCGRREAAALEHAARLTAQHVAHRAAAERHDAKAQALAVDNASLRERITALEEGRSSLQLALSEETDRRNKENRVLARKVAELTEEIAEANKKLEWEQGENGVLKKKHASAIKELNRELQRALKRCAQLEAKLPTPDAPSHRTGSISSLSSGDTCAHDERLHNGLAETLPDIQIMNSSMFGRLFQKVREPDRQALIERIVSLQRAAARRSDRCEFLEEHVKQLTGELRAKAKLLRSVLCDLPAGAIASDDRDHNKNEIARLGGGAMAAVWGGDRTGITLDLSLEMNKRLQAVLEDTLLKNITLKENMDTLGAEISRLKEQCKGNNNDAKLTS